MAYLLRIELTNNTYGSSADALCERKKIEKEVQREEQKKGEKVGERKKIGREICLFGQIMK